jgi:N-acetylglutamate synthase-like GNAT family acetyltransferase
MIRRLATEDLAEVFEIVNDAASAYRGVIPADRWHDPYMPMAELQQQVAEGVDFWGYEDGGDLVGVMGIQPVDDVALIRHAYVRTASRQRGIGSQLLRFLTTRSDRPLLVGTWSAATWAVAFYEKHGFRLVGEAEKDRLLRRYWSIPERQIATSVVLADERWLSERDRAPETPG